MSSAGGDLLGGRAILVAEDEVMIAMLAEDVIDELGGRVIGVAPTCDEALAILAGSEPALILLDVNLDGGTSERVAEAAAVRGIPVLVSSGSDRKALSPVFQNLPMLDKPWTFDDMKAALGELLPPAAPGMNPASAGSYPA